MRTSAFSFGLVHLVLIPVVIAACCIVCTAQSVEAFDTLKIDSDLVDLKVSVTSREVLFPTPKLQQSDFLILEDGTPQEVLFFATADTPFDLLLLLDLSGSTADKIKLIRRSARNFVAATRSIDRVAIVTFTNVPAVVSQLTSDRELLKSSIAKIKKPTGGTNFWDAMRFGLENVLAPSAGRRKAVVLMTDGVDNALPDVFGPGSETSFTHLVDILRRSEALAFPMYLDT